MTLDAADEHQSEPAAAGLVFGDQLELARRYHAVLAGAGIVRGVIGPREAPRLWERHLLNSAVVAELLPACAHMVDVGSGAGLPALPMVICRPDLSAVLVEPLQRRVQFLEEIVDSLGLSPRVSVLRGRAEEADVRSRLGSVAWVTARAVAPLDRLAAWCLPLLQPGGRLLALKGERAQTEVDEHRSALERAGGAVRGIEQCGVGHGIAPATVVVVERIGTMREDRSSPAIDRRRRR